MTKKGIESSHLRSCNQQMFGAFCHFPLFCNSAAQSTVSWRKAHTAMRRSWCISNTSNRGRQSMLCKLNHWQRQNRWLHGRFVRNFIQSRQWSLITSLFNPIQDTFIYNAQSKTTVDYRAVQSKITKPKKQHKEQVLRLKENKVIKATRKLSYWV